MIQVWMQFSRVPAALAVVVLLSAQAAAVVLVQETFPYATNAQLVAAGWQTGAMGVPAVANTYFFTGSGSNFISTNPSLQPPIQADQTLMRMGNAIAFRDLGATLTEDFTLTAKVAISGYSRSFQMGLGDANGAGYSVQWNAGSPSTHTGNGFVQIYAQSGWTTHSPNESTQPGTALVSTTTSGKTPPTAYPLPTPVTNPLNYSPSSEFLGYTELKLTWSAATGMLQVFQDNQLIPDEETLVTSAEDFDLYSSFSRLYIGGGTNAFVDSVRLETNQSVTLPFGPGDFDHDNDVDGRDFLMWQRGNSPTPLSSGDLNDWQANFGSVGSGAASTAAVPEPGCAALAVVALLAMAGSGRPWRRGLA